MLLILNFTYGNFYKCYSFTLEKVKWLYQNILSLSIVEQHYIIHACVLQYAVAGIVLFST